MREQRKQEEGEEIGDRREREREREREGGEGREGTVMR